MNVQKINEIHELTTAELELVAGGVTMDEYIWDLAIIGGGLFDAGTASGRSAQAAMDRAAQVFSDRFIDNLTAITPGGVNSWSARIRNPGTGADIFDPGLSGVAANVITSRGPAESSATRPCGTRTRSSLKKDLFKARSVNAATSTIPMPVIPTAIGNVFHAPSRIVISAAKPLNPGMPIDAADATTKAKATNGMVRLKCIPARSFRLRVWVRR